MRPPDIESSTIEQRREAVQSYFRCKGDCDLCGLCKVFKGKEPVSAFQDYIDGKRSFQEIMMEYRR